MTWNNDRAHGRASSGRFGSRGRRSEAARLVNDRAHLARAWRREALARCCTPSPVVNALGAMTGGQAVQMVQAGLKSIYVSGWQVAGDMNDACRQTYPDQSLYPANSVPKLVRSGSTTRSCAPIRSTARPARTARRPDWFAPIVADAEAGFGGV